MKQVFPAARPFRGSCRIKQRLLFFLFSMIPVSSCCLRNRELLNGLRKMRKACLRPLFGDALWSWAIWWKKKRSKSEDGGREDPQRPCSEYRNLGLLSGSDSAWECRHQIKITSHPVEDRSLSSPLPGAAHAQSVPLRWRSTQPRPPAEGPSEKGPVFDVWAPARHCESPQN